MRAPRHCEGHPERIQNPYGGCCSRIVLDRNSSIPRNTGNRRHLKGGHICADSKRFSVLQHCSRGWPWRQRRGRKSSSNWVFNPSVRMVITTMHRMPARPMVFTGLDISTTEYSWAWGRGLDGDMATAGAAIASVTVVEETIAAAVAPWPIVATMQAAERQCAVAVAGSM